MQVHADSGTKTSITSQSRRILEAVREGVSPEAATNIATMKKRAMAEAAEQRLAGTGWLHQEATA